LVLDGALERLWRNGYALSGAGIRTETRLRAADLQDRPPATACWDTGCEYKGVEFHSGARLTGDRQRMNALRAEGWLIHSVTASMVWHSAPRQVAELRAMFKQRH